MTNGWQLWTKKTSSRELWKLKGMKSIPDNEWSALYQQLGRPACFYLLWVFLFIHIGIFFMKGNLLEFLWLLKWSKVNRWTLLVLRFVRDFQCAVQCVPICLLKKPHFPFWVALQFKIRKRLWIEKKTKKNLSANLMSSFLFSFFLSFPLCYPQGGRRPPATQQTPPAASSLRPPSHPAKRWEQQDGCLQPGGVYCPHTAAAGMHTAGRAEGEDEEGERYLLWMFPLGFGSLKLCGFSVQKTSKRFHRVPLAVLLSPVCGVGTQTQYLGQWRRCAASWLYPVGTTALNCL